MNNNLAERLEQAIAAYIASPAKKYKSVFLVGHNLSEKIINQHKKYAPIQRGEKPLLAVNKILLYPFSGMGILITNQTLYYRLVNHNFKVIPLVTFFKKKPCGAIPLSSIRSIAIGDDVMTISGDYFGNQLLVNGEVIGLLPFTLSLNWNGIGEELNQIFKAFNENE